MGVINKNNISAVQTLVKVSTITVTKPKVLNFLFHAETKFQFVVWLIMILCIQGGHIVNIRCGRGKVIEVRDMWPMSRRPG